MSSVNGWPFCLDIEVYIMYTLFPMCQNIGIWASAILGKSYINITTGFIVF